MGTCEKILSFRHCAETGCTEAADFRAPVLKRADGEIDYGVFCKIHARARNGQWNYFADMNADEIEDFRHQSYSWHKSTVENLSKTALHAVLHSTDFLDDNVLFSASGIKTQKRVIPPEIKQALEQMQLEDVPDEASLKARFRLLVKRYHPDVQPENPHNLARLQSINSAYKTLKEYLCREIV